MSLRLEVRSQDMENQEASSPSPADGGGLGGGSKRRIAFFGSPAWAVPVLEALHQHHDVLLVVTQPDKPAGRGLKLTECPVAQRANQLGLRLLKPKKLKGNEEFLAALTSLNLDAAVSAAYGKLIPAEVLDVPHFGFLNLHPSLLPKYRGAAPVQRTLINGETETGVTIMKTDAGMDTGPIISQWRTAVLPDEDAVQLSERLRDKGTEMLLEALGSLERLAFAPQPSQGTLAPLLSKEDGRIRWTDSSNEIYNRYRGVQPWPGSWFLHQGKRVKVLALRPTEGRGHPGEVIGLGSETVDVATRAGAVQLKVVQPEGRQTMPAASWARGQRLAAGTLLTS